MHTMLQQQLQFLSSPPVAVKFKALNPKFCHTSSFSYTNSIDTSHGFSSNISTISFKEKVTKKLLVKCRHSDYFEQKKFSDSSSFSSQSPAGATTAGGLPPRFFVGHSIYKGKAALTVEPRAPEFVALDSGAFKLSKEGFVLLQFAPAAGVRQYDWSRKQVFSLSVTEIGTLVSLGTRESCEFFHDPFKGKRCSKQAFKHGREYLYSNYQSRVHCPRLSFQFPLAIPYRLACIC